MVLSQDSPVLYNGFCSRSESKFTAVQDVLYAFSKNTELSKKNEPGQERNDIIGVSSIVLPLKHYTIPSAFHNFYNALDYERVSHFSDTKSIIVC